MTDTERQSNTDDTRTGPSRRAFLALAAGGAAAVPLLTSCGSGTTTTPAASTLTKPPAPQRGSRPNIVFVFTDQERYFRSWPSGMSLPARERLAEEGVTFHHHYTSAVMCTSSRAVMLTGLQTPDNGMFEKNADLPYVNAMSTTVPTIGHLLRKAGYYTAYQGKKWHLDAAFDREPVQHVLTDRMDAYGFSDFGLPVDSLAHDLGGYTTDSVIAAGAQSWLRNTGRPMADDGRPWALFVSLINPHDIMYFNTDKPSEQVQDTGTLLMHAARAPQQALYQQHWDSALPASLEQPMQEPGRPRAHGEFLKAWGGYTLGTIPPESDRWQRFTDFYLNSIRSVDHQMSLLLGELDNLALRGNTIVVFTSDHGEMAGGAHGLRGKGPFAYEESIHLPCTSYIRTSTADST